MNHTDTFNQGTDNQGTDNQGTEKAVSDKLITVEVAYALPDRQKIIALQVPQGTRAAEAVRLSKISGVFPEINLGEATMGIFSQVLGSKGLPAPEDYELRDGDRVEIYRPLIADPKEVRKRRAAEAKARRAAEGALKEDAVKARAEQDSAEQDNAIKPEQ